MTRQNPDVQTAFPAIPVPSADLINYRFDQTDKKMEEINKKIDAIILQNGHFLSEDAIVRLIDNQTTPINQRLDGQGRYWLAVFTGVIAALALSILNYISSGKH